MADDTYFASGGVISWAVSGRRDDTVPAVLNQGCHIFNPASEPYSESAKKMLRRIKNAELEYLWEPRD